MHVSQLHSPILPRTINHNQVLNPAAMVNGKLFREYIGGHQRKDITFKTLEPIIDGSLTFDFLLAFAIDCDVNDPPNPTNGKFMPFWDTEILSPDAVAAIKGLHTNVRVMLSIGGAKLKNKDVFFSPKTKTEGDAWVDNAVSSLTGIIDEYRLDGVDINYEKFAEGNTTQETFSSCVGELLCRLKGIYQQPEQMFITSIAPYGLQDAQVQKFYTQLWADHRRNIDYVNFQFFGCGPINNVDTYLEKYNEQITNYPDATILASFQTGENKRLKPRVALDAAKKLHEQGRLPGLFIWSVDNSFNENDESKKFRYEREAQEILSAATSNDGGECSSLNNDAACPN